MADSKSNADVAPAELTVVVDELLNQLSTKFTSVSTELIAKMDSMSRRLDALEATIQSSGGNRTGGDGPEKRDG